MEEITNEFIESEFYKCKSSPYYFATKYFVVDGKPFTTHLTEEEFNKQYNYLKGINHENKNKRRVF